MYLAIMIENDNRIISSESTEEDLKEGSLRPQKLSDFIGQEKLKKNLKIYIEAAKMRNESIEHVLLYGPPGLGKTTFAGIVSNEMNVNIKITSAKLLYHYMNQKSACKPFFGNSKKLVIVSRKKPR